MADAVEAFFLPADAGRGGQRFCLLHRPRGAVKGAVVHVHAFAEEMNKSRRMVALQARALAQEGYAVLLIDLLGCGDSSGDFEDASWDHWLADVAQAARWLQTRYAAPLWLWGHRAGALIAVEAVRQWPTPCHFLFWQPATAGKLLLQQFLRLKVASEMLSGESKGVMATLRQQIAAGSAVEVAGYRLPPALAAGLERAVLAPPAGAGRTVWCELSTLEGATLLPASQTCIANWRSAGIEVHADVANGPAFWQTTEIEDAPALIRLTQAALPRGETVAA